MQFSTGMVLYKLQMQYEIDCLCVQYRQILRINSRFYIEENEKAHLFQHKGNILLCFISGIKTSHKLVPPVFGL